LFSVFQDTTNAERAYERLWETNERDNKAFSAMISIYEVTGQFEKAVGQLEKWLVVFPTDSNARIKLQEMQDKSK